MYGPQYFGDYLFGPYMLSKRLNAIGYLNILPNTLPDYLDGMPLDVRRKI